MTIGNCDFTSSLLINHFNLLRGQKGVSIKDGIIIQALVDHFASVSCSPALLTLGFPSPTASLDHGRMAA